MNVVTAESHVDATSSWPWRLASAFMLVVGLFLRWSGLGRFPFEQDELYTLQESRELFETTLRPGINARPLYYLLHHTLTPVLPVSELGARLPAFFFGFLGLVVTWRLGRYLAGGAGGFLALTLCAFSPWHLFVSGEARYWSLIYLIAASTTLALLQARDTDRWHAHLAAGVLLMIGCLTHPTFLFPMAGIATALLLEPSGGGLTVRMPTRRALLGTWLPAGLVIGGYLLALRLTGRGSTLSNWSGRGWLATLRLTPAVVQLISPALFASGVVGVISALTEGSFRAKRFALVAALGGTAGIALLLAASIRTDVYADYAVSMLPLVIGAATCLLLSPSLARRGEPTLAIAFILVAAMLPETVSQISDGMRFDYRPAFARIASSAPDRLALVRPLVVQRHYAPELHAIEFMQTIPQLDSVFSTSLDFWVVGSENREGLLAPNSEVVQQWLDIHCHRALATSRQRLDYRTYRVVLYSCAKDDPPSNPIATEKE